MLPTARKIPGTCFFRFSCLVEGLGASIGALIIRIGFWGPLHYTYPQVGIIQAPILQYSREITGPEIQGLV